MGDIVPVTREKKREPVVAVENRSVGFPRSGGRVLGVRGSGSFHGPVPILGARAEKMTAQEAPGTTIDSRRDPDYPPRGASSTDVVDVPTFRWPRIQASPD